MMKNYFLTAVMALSIMLPAWMHAQVSDFEDLNLESDSYWNGSDLSGGFLSGKAWFFNNYDTTYGSWDGFSYSTMRDDSTAGWANQYSAYPAGGANGSATYAVAHVSSDWMSGTYDPVPVGVKLQDPLAGGTVQGVYVTNSTYAVLSMLNGDAYAKKFGGESGDDPDWFMLIIRGYNEGSYTDSVTFYLADYRFEDNDLDYIVDYWAYIDLTSLGNVDSLTFSLRSSDTGDYGMNTPAYFCLDNLNDISNGIAEAELPEVIAYPNPVINTLRLHGVENATVTLSDFAGRVLFNKANGYNDMQINMSEYPKGLYFVTVIKNGKAVTRKVLKQ